MNVTAHFGRHLTQSNIEDMAKRHGFASQENVEKFLIDLEVLYHMRRVMPDCVVMGGMAVPFHLGQDAIARLSIDIDAVTGLDAACSRRAMGQVFRNLDGTIRDAKPHKPRSPKKTLPLHTYFCSYDSAIDHEVRDVKIDLFYGGRPAARTTRFRPPTTLLGVKVDFEVAAYGYSQMIADKLSTLAFRTIGLDATDPGVPKHIHDIASLIMSGRGKIDVSEIATAFEQTRREESGYIRGRPPTSGEVYDSLRTFHDGLLVAITGLELDVPYAGRFGHFAANMLTRSQSKKRLHATNVMLTGILAGMVADVCTSELAAEDVTRRINQVRETLGKIFSMSADDANGMARELRRAYRKGSHDYNLVKTMRADQAYLYGHLRKLARA